MIPMLTPTLDQYQTITSAGAKVASATEKVLRNVQHGFLA